MRNNWLSFVLSEESRNELYQICIKLSGILDFNAMSYNGLHMTAVFMGKSYRSKDHDKLFETINEEKISGSFEFDRLEFFPPSKKNLIVAVFKASKGVTEKIKCLKEKIREEFKYDIDYDEFFPHVTLGKLNITKKKLETLIKNNPLLELTSSVHDKNLIDFVINNDGPLYLCGEMK